MKDTITLPRQLVQDAVDSFRDHRLEYWDTRRCDTEKALRAALDAPEPQPPQNHAWAAISKTSILLFWRKENAEKMTPTPTSHFCVERLPIFDAPVEAPPPQNLEYIAQLKATSVILRSLDEPVTFNATKIAIADAIDALLLAVAAPKVEPAHPTDLEKVIDDYIEDYEMVGESEDGRDAIYTPTENDKALLKDAILGLLVDTDWDAAWGAHIDSLVSARAAKIETWTDADADAARLALELECLLNDTADMSIVSKWWASSMEALDLHRARISAKPNTLKKLDAMERLLIARQQPASKAEPRRVPLTEEQIDKVWGSLDYTMTLEKLRVSVARAIEAEHGIKEGS